MYFLLKLVIVHCYVSLLYQRVINKWRWFFNWNLNDVDTARTLRMNCLQFFQQSETSICFTTFVWIHVKIGMIRRNKRNADVGMGWSPVGWLTMIPWSKQPWGIVPEFFRLGVVGTGRTEEWIVYILEVSRFYILYILWFSRTPPHKFNIDVENDGVSLDKNALLGVNLLESFRVHILKLLRDWITTRPCLASNCPQEVDQ